MLTKVVLEGPMGKALGRNWAFDISSPAEALRMVNANRPGVFNWIKKNLAKYESYRVVCKYEDGRTEELDKDSFMLNAKPLEIRFTPLIEGAGAAGRIILGIVLIVAAIYVPALATYAASMIGAGVSMVLGGVIQMLTPQPKRDSEIAESKNKTSYYFDGPVNTTEQGVPVQLIYGEVLVGSHAVSAQVTIDQLM